MKRTLLGFLAVCGMLTSILMAQGTPITQPGTNPNPPAAAPAPAVQRPIVVVDYMYLMQIHPKLAKEKAGMEENRQKVVSELQAGQQQLQSKAREVNALTPGTQGYSNARAEYTRLETDLKNKALNADEAYQIQLLQATYNAYREIQGIVEAYAKQNGTILVLNHIDVSRRLPSQQSLETMDLAMTQMQTPIAWAHAQYDITPIVEKSLNDYFLPQGYAKVDYEKIKEQMFNTKPSAPGTNVAVAPGQPGR